MHLCQKTCHSPVWQFHIWQRLHGLSCSLSHSASAPGWTHAARHTHTHTHTHTQTNKQKLYLFVTWCTSACELSLQTLQIKQTGAMDSECKSVKIICSRGNSYFYWWTSDGWKHITLTEIWVCVTLTCSFCSRTTSAILSFSCLACLAFQNCFWAEYRLMGHTLNRQSEREHTALEQSGAAFPKRRVTDPHGCSLQFIHKKQNYM